MTNPYIKSKTTNTKSATKSSGKVMVSDALSDAQELIWSEDGKSTKLKSPKLPSIGTSLLSSQANILSTRARSVSVNAKLKALTKQEEMERKMERKKEEIRKKEATLAVREEARKQEIRRLKEEVRLEKEVAKELKREEIEIKKEEIMRRREDARLKKERAKEEVQEQMELEWERQRNAEVAEAKFEAIKNLESAMERVEYIKEVQETLQEDPYLDIDDVSVCSKRSTFSTSSRRSTGSFRSFGMKSRKVKQLRKSRSISRMGHNKKFASKKSIMNIVPVLEDDEEYYKANDKHISAVINIPVIQEEREEESPRDGHDDDAPNLSDMSSYCFDMAAQEGKHSFPKEDMRDNTSHMKSKKSRSISGMGHNKKRPPKKSIMNIVPVLEDDEEYFKANDKHISTVINFPVIKEERGDESPRESRDDDAPNLSEISSYCLDTATKEGEDTFPKEDTRDDTSHMKSKTSRTISGMGLNKKLANKKLANKKSIMNMVPVLEDDEEYFKANDKHISSVISFPIIKEERVDESPRDSRDDDAPNLSEISSYCLDTAIQNGNDPFPEKDVRNGTSYLSTLSEISEELNDEVSTLKTKLEQLSDQLGELVKPAVEKIDLIASSFDCEEKQLPAVERVESNAASFNCGEKKLPVASYQEESIVLTKEDPPVDRIKYDKTPLSPYEEIVKSWLVWFMGDPEDAAHDRSLDSSSPSYEESHETPYKKEKRNGKYRIGISF